jgi:pyridoxal phosphate enzyme (YggS family)
LTIGENIRTISENLDSGVTLIAVSKTKPSETIMEAYSHGIRDFGENKVQELLSKMDELPNDIKWHLIGHLQRNKVKYIVGRVHLIHSLDSIKLLEEIEKQYSAKDITADVLIQINIGREASKTGIMQEELDELIAVCENCQHVKVKGLMSIIPPGDEAACRNYFRQMKIVWERLKTASYKNLEMKYLSMGMTEDYKIAISEGANMIRVGTGIFGSRS